MGKRGPKKGQGGRPRGGKYPEAIREYWRMQKAYKHVETVLLGPDRKPKRRSKKK